MTPENEPWLDENSGRLVRPYTVSDGRTTPTNKLDLLSLVMSTGQIIQTQLDHEHAQALSLCQDPTSVAEVAAYMHLPAVVTKVLLSDLVDCGAVTTKAPSSTADPTDQFLLETLLNGLQQRL